MKVAKGSVDVSLVHQQHPGYLSSQGTVGTEPAPAAGEGVVDPSKQLR